MYQRKVDVDMLNPVKIKLADVSSVSPSSEQRSNITNTNITTITTNNTNTVWAALNNWAELFKLNW